MEYDNPQYPLSAIEAAQKNDAEPMSERIRFAVHELTHHLIAERCGLICDGIELGYKAGWPRSAAGLAHYGDDLRRKRGRREPITPQQDEAYVHAALSNGYGDEAVFGTEPERRGDDDDLRKAIWHMETEWEFDPDEVKAFMETSIKETRKFLSDPKIRQTLRTAATRAAREYWGTGQLMQRDAVNEVLNIKRGT
jgi:hypothetical protein